MSLSPLRDRFAALTPRERALLAAGAAAIILFLLYLLTRDGSEEPVELTSNPPAATSPAMLPSPPPPVASPPMQLASAPAPAAMGGIVLRGVMGGGPGGGAGIFDTPGGAQRVVRVGREIAPGMVLREVGVRHAIASAGAGDVRFELGKAGGVTLAAAPGGGNVSGPVAAGAQSAARETMQYRLALQPVEAGGRISGYAIKPGAKLPQLARAGLQPGDVIVRVNGQKMQSEEDVNGLHEEIASSGVAEFEILRGGRMVKARLPVNVP